MKRNTLFVILCCCIIAFSGCSILQFSNLLNCKFAMSGVRNVTWAGINFSNINSLQDLSITNMTKALDAIKRMDFTVTCDVNVKTENPTNRMARLIGYDYELFLRCPIPARADRPRACATFRSAAEASPSRKGDSATHPGGRPLRP